MVAVSNPFGFIPTRHLTGAEVRTHMFGSRALGSNGIAATDTNAIYIGQPVKLVSTGVVTRAMSTDILAGIFAGCEYDDSTGRHIVGYWNGAASSTNIVAYVYSDPNIIFMAQADGAVTQSGVGGTGQMNTTQFNGSTATQNSTASLNHTIGTSTLQFEVVGIAALPNNAVNDSFTIVEVKINKSIFDPGTGTAGI